MKKIFIIIAGIIGLAFFYEFVLVGNPEEKSKSAESEQAVDNFRKNPSDSGILDQRKGFSLQSILESIAEQNEQDKQGSQQGTNDQKQSLEELLAPKNSVSQQDSKSANQQDEKVQAIRDYFIASSRIPFPKDRAELGLALALAENGDLSKLEEIIKAHESARAKFVQMKPPEELKSFHEQSLSVVDRFIQLLKDSLAKKRGSVKETWNSLERKEIEAEASRLVQQAKQIVEQYKIELPPDVLP